MSGTGPHLNMLRLWAKREGMCLAILERALLLLRTERAFPESEIDLNRRLYFCVLTASSELYPRDPVAPESECNNQPDPDDISRVAREQKRPDWVFNLNYVRHGICRFRDPEWAYAKRFSSGAMVGYCQSMEPAQVLKEVNEEVGQNSLPRIIPVGQPASDCQKLEHTFERSFPVSPFHLLHLWIDLRPSCPKKAEGR